MVQTRSSQEGSVGAGNTEMEKGQLSLDSFTKDSNQKDANTSNQNDSNTNDTNGRKKRKVEENDVESTETKEPEGEESAKHEELEHKPAHGREPNEQKKSPEVQSANQTTTKDSETRDTPIPSSILEKGIIYFFFRPRVNNSSPQGVKDIARSHFVLRPLPLDCKLGSGPLEDKSDARLIALPKKMWPRKKTDRFLSFVEKAGVGVRELREVMAGGSYGTQNGTSETQPIRPFAEGIYALTKSGRESHLAYQITIPEEIDEVQKALGLQEKGSFICSVKNPEVSGPANAQLDNPAEYPKEVQDRFEGRRWMPVEPDVLDYEGTQILIMGHNTGDTSKGTGEEEEVEEEMEQLEKEDFERVEDLKEDDPVFADLGLSSKEYPHLQTTW